MKIYKIILLLFFCTFSQNIIAQTNFNRGYDKGWTEGFCYDKVGCVAPPAPPAPPPGYNESNDSFKDGYLRGIQHGQAEPDKKSNYSPKPTDFGEYYQPIDFDFLNKVLAAKESSPRSSGYKSTANKAADKRAFVARKVNPKIKKELKILERRNKKEYKASKKIKNKNRRNSLVNLKELKDGWYKIFIESTTFYKGQTRDILKERLLQLQNGKPIVYIGGNNLLYEIKNVNKVGSKYSYTIVLPDNSTENSRFLIYDKKPLKKFPEFHMPKTLIFYTTTDNGGGSITVVIDRKPDFPGLELTQKLSQSPSCSGNSNKLFLPPGEYQYYAYNKTTYWEGKIDITKPCNTLNLRSN